MAQLTFNPIANGSLATSPNGAIRATNIVTFKTAVAHGLTSEAVGYVVNIAGVTPTSFNASHVITEVVDADEFKAAQTGSDESSSGAAGTWSVSPAQFVDLGDSSLVGSNPLTVDILKKISHNAYFGAVRSEIFFMGYYRDTDTVPKPTSPVDGYQYSYAECLLVPIFASSRQPDGTFVVGQTTFPALNASDAGVGTLVAVPWKLSINKTTGVVQSRVYFGTSGDTGQGTVAVWCLAQRSSVN